MWFVRKSKYLEMEEARDEYISAWMGANELRVVEESRHIRTKEAAQKLFSDILNATERLSPYGKAKQGIVEALYDYNQSVEPDAQITVEGE